MFDGKQVLTITNKIKSSDIGGLSKELTDRIGTSNYDTNRTKYNIEFIPLCSTNLASSTYKTLYKNNVEFNKNNKNINLLNGCIITSGQEFFKSLGMKFEDTGRKYLTGEHKRETINKVVINNPNDILEQVLNYFKCSHEFLNNLVGKENVVYSAIHFDEDTPYMHFYFTPVVNEVYRKVFETDSNGHQILKSYIGKDGKEKLIPIQKKDEKGKNLYSIEKGKFLNCDQFWKDKGFKTSFAKIQDDYNKFITSKGFNLDRGQIGGNKHHQTKAEKAGVRRIRLHDFRHSCASALISGSAPITAVSNFLGHYETTETLETYTHMFKKELANVPKFFDTLEKDFNEKSSE